jgi:hypothetical protein
MLKSTLPVNGGTMPKIDRAAVMRRAWAIFAESYKFPQIKFKDIGRKCFAWALRQAWAEAREAARLAVMPAQARAERIETLNLLLDRAAFIDSGPAWQATVAAYRTEIRQLQTA